MRSQYDMVESVTAPDAATVVFQLTIPYGGLADILTDRQVKIVPRNATALATQPIGTGPFKFVSYTAGDRLVLARHANYFERGLPKLDGVELRIIPEMSVKIAALQAGDIEVLWDLPLEQVKTLSSRAELRVDSVPTASWDGAILNNEIPPFNDKRVRQAFHLAVDKKEVVELTLFGQGVDTISPIPPSHPFYAKDVVVPKADPAAARKLLAEAGHPNGIKLPIILPVGRPVRERLGVTLQQLAKAGGFDLQVQRLPYSSFNAEVSGKAPLYIDGFFARPTVDTSLFPFLRSKGSWNERLWHYSDADRRPRPRCRPVERRPGRAEEELHRHAGGAGREPGLVLRLFRQLRLRLSQVGRRREDAPDEVVRPAHRDAEADQREGYHMWQLPVVSTEGRRPERRDLLSTIGRLSWNEGLSTPRGVYSRAKSRGAPVETTDSATCDSPGSRGGLRP